MLTTRLIQSVQEALFWIQMSTHPTYSMDSHTAMAKTHLIKDEVTNGLLGWKIGAILKVNICTWGFKLYNYTIHE